jgi:hypothetical protein
MAKTENAAATADAADNTAKSDVVDKATGEIASLPALTSTNKVVILPGGKTITLIAQLNKVLLTHHAGQSVFITVTGKTFTGKEIKGSKMAPATMVPIIDIETGQEKEYIVNAVMLGLLTDTYPGESFVGKSFAVYKGDQREGKRYSDIQLSEISVK